jgi:hypothetical protein
MQDRILPEKQVKMLDNLQIDKEYPLWYTENVAGSENCPQCVEKVGF